MGLQVLLPLTTDLANKGLLNFKLSNDNITDVTDGKIGHCKKLTVGKNVVFIPDLNSNNISFGGWFKFNKSEISSVLEAYQYDSTRTLPTGNLLGNNSFGGIGICWNGNNMSGGSFTEMSISLYFRTSSLGGKTIGTFTVSFDTWIHVFATFDVSTKIIKLFKDATLVKQTTLPSFSDFPSRAIALNSNSIYGGRGPGISIPIYTNDIRIYDECLSENDVKRLFNNKTFDLVNQCNVAFDRAGQIASGVIPYNVTTSGSDFYLNGSDAAIQIPFTDMQSGEFTMNTWFYKDSFGSKSWETIFGGPSGFELEMKRSNTNSPVIVPHSWEGSSISALDITYALNQWNMLTMVRNTNKTMFYLNGEYKVSGSAGSVPATSSTAGQYFIGAWKTYDAQNFKGYIKDFQIYAKELQASEISQLYEIGPQTDTDFSQNYTRLEYIQATGTQYINTGCFGDATTTITLDYEYQELKTGIGIIGTGMGSTTEPMNGFRFYYTGSNNKFYVSCYSKLNASTLSSTPLIYINQKYHSVMYGASGVVITNGQSTTVRSYGAGSNNTYQMVLFKPYTTCTKAKLYKCIISKNGIYEREFIPAKRKSDNVVGMYDMVTKTFFTNAGTGTFTAGPEF